METRALASYVIPEHPVVSEFFTAQNDDREMALPKLRIYDVELLYLQRDMSTWKDRLAWCSRVVQSSQRSAAGKRWYDALQKCLLGDSPFRATATCFNIKHITPRVSFNMSILSCYSSTTYKVPEQAIFS